MQVTGASSGNQCAVCREAVIVTELSPNLLAKSLVDEQLVRFACSAPVSDRVLNAGLVGIAGSLSLRLRLD